MYQGSELDPNMELDLTVNPDINSDPTLDPDMDPDPELVHNRD